VTASSLALPSSISFCISRPVSTSAIVAAGRALGGGWRSSASRQDQ
jgi:hypothetical protein